MGYELYGLTNDEIQISEIVDVENETEREYSITLEIDKAFKTELDKRSERMKLDPHPGYSFGETISYLEEKVGRKI